ncbi:MAG: hypothetical protein IKH49_08985 [Bacteroidales bacterium]|nr:hypothetical protein [Bacteroidales bacterium]
MKIERLSRKDAIEAMNSWVQSSFTVPALGRDYSDIRTDLCALFEAAREEVDGDVRDYRMDVCFGAALYDYFNLNKLPWFTLRLASDDGFWRHLALRVIPDLVGERWGESNADHYYAKPSRIWPKTLWWFFHLSLSGTGAEDTKKMLLSGNFSTDTVLNLVERTGRCGTNISVYREIMTRYANLKGVVDRDFRNVMKLNTAKAVVIEPVFCEGGVSGYVGSIFSELSLDEQGNS